MSEKTRHINIPVFIPHLGCPNACVFCNQRTISGTSDFREEDVRGIIDGALATVPRDSEVEIAFFGGSFTGIDRSLMLRLLDLADEYIDAGKVTALRCSTRPDYIDDEILSMEWKEAEQEKSDGDHGISRDSLCGADDLHRQYEGSA